jgi:hypothetical protein
LSVTARPPADAVVALRSLGRRWRGLFAGLGEDESPDDLALVADDAVLHPAVGDPSQREWKDQTTGTVDDAIAELAHEAERLADRVDRVTADEWRRRARVAGRDADVAPLDVLWDAVDSAVAELRAAERTLREVRGR